MYVIWCKPNGYLMGVPRTRLVLWSCGEGLIPVCLQITPVNLVSKLFIIGNITS